MAVLTAPLEREALANDSPTAATLRYHRRGDQQRHTLPLSLGKYTIGSSPQCQLCLTSPEVRPLQCVIFLEIGAATITRWATGVELNGHQFSKADLNDGDRLTIGDWQLEFDSGGSIDVVPTALIADDSSPVCAPELPPPAAAEAIIAASQSREELESLPGATVEVVLAPPAQVPSSQTFADALLLHLWTANDRARRRAKSLITGVRAARFQTDAVAADLSAIETELDLTRAAYDTHLGNHERLQQELTQQHEERVAPLLEEIAALRSHLDAVQAHLASQTAEYETLSDETAALRMALQSPAVDPALVSRVEDLETAAAAYSRDIKQLTGELRVAQQECTRLTATKDAEAARAEELAIAVANRTQELERLAAELRLAQHDQQRLAGLYQLEAERAALKASRVDELELLAASHPQELKQLADDLKLAQQEQDRLVNLHRLEADRAVQEAERASAAAERAEEWETAVAVRSQEREKLASQLHLAQQEHGRILELYQIEAERSAQEAQRASVAVNRADELESTIAVHSQQRDQLASELQLAQQEHERLAEQYQIEVERANQVMQRAAQEANRAAQLEEQLSEERAQFAAAVEQARSDAAAAANAEQRTATDDPWPIVAPPVNTPAAVEEADAVTAFTPQADQLGTPVRNDAAVAEPHLAAPTPAPEQPAPEYAPKSFIDAYRHLLDGDDAPETPKMSPQGGRPIIDEEFLSPAKVETCATPLDDSDDQLEAYMAKMMHRVRGSSPSYVSSQAVAAEQASGAGAGLNPSSLPTVAADVSATASNQHSDEPFSMESMKQATRKPPLASDLASLREIANDSARTAIAAHSQRQSRESVMTRIAIGLTAMASAAYLMASAPAITEWHFWAGVATCAIGGTSAVQALLIERRGAADRAKSSDTSASRT